ncbi:MAG: alpha-glucan family phosphorylase [Phycisphaerales bacterium]|nr:alpha-glucan family phosphorylase [Phycisphaerales bacterium]
MTKRNPDRRVLRGPTSDIFTRVATVARNLWWSWNPDAQRLFAALDPPLWEASGHNPLRVLELLSPERRETLAGDERFTALLADVEQQLAAYLGARTWLARRGTARQKRARIAYFCAEFALHESLPMYAGGLGVLAGDHLKSASDLGIPLVGVGLLYRNGYHRQELLVDGATRPVYPRHDFTRLPITDTGVAVDVPLARRDVKAKVWQATVGRVPLYLLDCDLPDNRPADRAITQRLYGGDQETRIAQEIVLGVGGVRALRALGHDITVFHLNEGHAAFCNVERLRHLLAARLSRRVALQRVRESSVFTTHTPVPAGHDRFPPALLLRYLGPMLADVDLPPEELLALGRENPADRKEPFCMTVLALRTSARCNGVSRLHGAVSREMWMRVYHARKPGDVPIGHITNGVHSETWLAPEIRPLYDKYLRPRWVGAGPEDDWWKRVDRIPLGELWSARRALRARLVQFVRQRLRYQLERRCEPASELLAALRTFDEDALTIGFARRFATYKRAPLIFSNPRRLAAILGDPSRPVQIVFAGKAHPADREGQALAQRIYRMARDAGFRGRVALIEDYDMHVGRVLTSGCDLWLNNPLRPQEASGTSGMKPPLHGGLNCSILDGWWPEAYDRRNGWAIPEHADAPSRTVQDRREAEALYDLLEGEIVPEFYRRDRRGLPLRWLARMQASLRTVCPVFNTHRMLSEYLELYVPENA